MYYQRNRMLAFLLNLIPGLGHLYWGNRGRGVSYPIFFFGILFGGALLAAVGQEGGIFLVALVTAFILWCISLIDLFVSMLRHPVQSHYGAEGPGYPQQLNKGEADSERFFTILLSFIPGLGHFQMGLMQRGLSFLIMFFGLITMVFLVSGITNEGVFLLFLGLLPIIWLYCMFDAVQLIHRKQSGEVLIDRTLFDEWESGRIEGRRSKVLATLLSAFPGAGQMYLGLQKRGLQLMILFIGSFYIIDVLRLSVFLFILPVIWFYSFFDGLQQTSRYGVLPLDDIPLIKGRGNQEHWLGITLLLFGIYYIVMNLLVPTLDMWYPDLRISYRIHEYLRPALVSLILIGGGIKLLSRKNRKQYVNWDEEI